MFVIIVCYYCWHGSHEQQQVTWWKLLMMGHPFANETQPRIQGFSDNSAINVVITLLFCQYIIATMPKHTTRGKAFAFTT
jgi:predicted membrane-bound dolichyl-phosphate-mannose-protein mannosyltransferase